MEAEAIAIREAIYHCISKGVDKVCVETDSLFMVKILTGEWQIPWRMMTLVENIKQLPLASQVTITHIYREGNTLVDMIANIAFERDGITCYNTFTDLPVQGRRILNLEKQQMPNLRIQTKRINQQIMREREATITT